MYKAWLYFVVCVFYCLISDVFSEDNDCEYVPLNRCNLEINTELIPGNRTKFPEICLKILRYRLCVIVNEFQTKDLCGWPLVMKKAESLIDELCYKDTLLREMFLEVAPCLKAAILNHKADCEVWVNIVFNEIRRYPEYESIQNTTFEQCTKNTCTAECYRLYMLGECGKTAEYIYTKILQRSSFYLLKCNSPKQHQLAFTLVNYLHENLDQGTQMHLIESNP